MVENSGEPGQGLTYEPARKSNARPILRAAGFYFAIVFGAGMLLGPAREFWLEPWMGETLSVAAESPFLLAAMWFGARAAPRWAGLEGRWSTLLAVGLIAFAAQQLADLSVGFGLRGAQLNAQIEYFKTPAGLIYALCLALFVLMPLARHLWGRRPSRATSVTPA